jgi:hypothetical protein
MEYDVIAEIFMAETATPFPEPVLPTTPARRLRDALEPIATQGWWSRPAGEAVDGLGLGFFDGYVWGRAAGLGTPAPAVVVATFGVFEPGFVGGAYELASGKVPRDEVLAARAAAATEAVAVVASDSDAATIADPLLGVLAGVEGIGRPLFSGLRELPVPDEPAGRLWRAAELVREHRGDGHLAALASAGIGMVAANVLTELWLGFRVGEYTGTRGFGPDQVGAAVAALEGEGLVADGQLTSAGRARRDAIEEATDRSQADLVTALGDRLDPIIEAADAVSTAIVGARQFPTDPRKRAAG